MTPDGRIDDEGLRRLIDYQQAAGVDGIVAVGTTGESSTLSPAERLVVLQCCLDRVKNDLIVIAGTGSNSTEEALRSTRAAWDAGVMHALLVDPYYNAPSSLEIRREYYGPIARALPEMGILPYVIPGRTGTRLEPPDLALLREACPNVVGVKDATGSEEYSREVRSLAGVDFAILSGDDARTRSLIEDPAIRSQGVISVMSNVLPGALSTYVKELRLSQSQPSVLGHQARGLEPLLSLVTVEAAERVSKGIVRVKARNPVPVKTIMNILGMPAGPCRPPLGRLTRIALNSILNALRSAHEQCPGLFDQVEEVFDVSVEDRLHNERHWEGLAYDD